jgi:putative endonuclease
MMANDGRMLYTGVTNDLQRRVFEHKRKLIKGYASKYDITRLVYYEATPNVLAAITREKQIKGWLRKKKIALIESVNPGWSDLSEDWDRDQDSSPAAQNDTGANARMT